MQSPIDLFKEIYEDPNNYEEDKKLKPEAVNKIQAIDFSGLDIDQIQIIEDAEYLPDDLALSILKGWMNQQNDVLSNIRGSLVFNSNLQSKQFQTFINAMKLPSLDCDYVVHDILEKIASGGGVYKAKDINNILNYNSPNDGLIRCEQSKSNNYSAYKTIENLFDFNPETFYIGPSVDKAFITIILPSFLKVNLRSYKLISPPFSKDKREQGGISNWEIYGFNNEEECILLDSRKDNTDLLKPSSIGVFEVPQNNHYFRNFKLVISGENHQRNKSIILSGIDITGSLFIGDD